jgi:hypothetical protein
MRILVDENIPRMTVDRLRELGHDVKDIRSTGDKGLSGDDRRSCSFFVELSVQSLIRLVSAPPDGDPMPPGTVVLTLAWPLRRLP